MYSTMVRRSDPETSHAAAASLSTHRLTRDKARVEAIHLAAPAGLTDEELLHRYIAAHGATAESTPRKRRCDLTKDGIIVETERERLLISGRYGIVWQHRAHVT
jgi:hypothetical protein